MLNFGQGGVDDILSIEVGHTHFRDGPIERDVGHGQGRGGCQGSQLVGHSILVSRDKGYLNLNFGMEIVGEKGAQGTVDQAGNQNFMLRGTGFALEKAAGEASHCGIFLLVINCKGHEIDILSYLFLRAYGSEKHRVVHSYNG